MLATEATALLHGRDEAEKARETARNTFERGSLDENLPTVETAGGLSDEIAAHYRDDMRRLARLLDRDLAAEFGWPL